MYIFCWQLLFSLLPVCYCAFTRLLLFHYLSVISLLHVCYFVITHLVLHNYRTVISLIPLSYCMLFTCGDGCCFCEAGFTDAGRADTGFRHGPQLGTVLGDVSHTLLVTVITAVITTHP